MLKQTHHESEDNSNVSGQWRSETLTSAETQCRRYDTDAVRDMLALAARLQTEQQADHETMSADEVIETGTEAGIDPAFIHQAMAILEGEGGTAPSLSAAPASVNDRRSARTRRSVRSKEDTAFYAVNGTETRVLRKLHRRAKVATVLYPLAFLALAMIVGSNSPDAGLVLVGVVVAPLMACLLGGGLRSVRLGAIAGMLIATALFLSIMAAHPVRGSGEAFQCAVVWGILLFLGASLGVAGAVGRRLLPRLFLGLARRFPVLAES